MERKVPLGNWFNHILELIRSEINYNMQDYHLDSAGFTVLYYMAMYGDGMTQAELTKMLILDKAAVSRTLKALESSGYIRKEDHLSDGRKQHLFLTEEGRKLQSYVSEVYDKIFNQLSEGISKDEIYQCLTTLNAVHENALIIKDKRHADRAGDSYKKGK